MAPMKVDKTFRNTQFPGAHERRQFVRYHFYFTLWGLLLQAHRVAPETSGSTPEEEEEEKSFYSWPSQSVQ